MIPSSGGAGGTASNAVAGSVPLIAADRVEVVVDCKMGHESGGDWMVERVNGSEGEGGIE